MTIRTLRYYDKIGLLKPTRNPNNDYRQYTQAEENRLQEIRALQLAEMPQSQKKQLLDGPTDQLTATQIRQRQRKTAKRDQLVLLR